MAPYQDVGTVYIYRRNDTSWTQEAVIAPGMSDVSSYAEGKFGYSVKLSESANKIVIGSPAYVGEGNLYGSVLIYSRSNADWTLEKSIRSDQISASSILGVELIGASFGIDVDISSDGLTVLIGAYAAKVNNVSGAGAGFIYENKSESWELTGVLKNSSDLADHLGYSVALGSGGTRVIIGAYLTQETPKYSGKVFIFDKEGEEWVMKKELRSLTPVVGDKFGYSVTLDSSGNHLLVGVPYKDQDSISNTGAVEYFVIN